MPFSKKNKTTVVIPNGCDKREFLEDQLCYHEPINIIYLGRLAKFHKGIATYYGGVYGTEKAQVLKDADASSGIESRSSPC